MGGLQVVSESVQITAKMIENHCANR